MILNINNLYKNNSKVLTYNWVLNIEAWPTREIGLYSPKINSKQWMSTFKPNYQYKSYSHWAVPSIKKNDFLYRQSIKLIWDFSSEILFVAKLATKQLFFRSRELWESAYHSGRRARSSKKISDSRGLENRNNVSCWSRIVSVGKQYKQLRFEHKFKPPFSGRLKWYLRFTAFSIARTVSCFTLLG